MFHVEHNSESTVLMFHVEPAAWSNSCQAAIWHNRSIYVIMERIMTKASSSNASNVGRRRLGRGLSSLLGTPVKVDPPVVDGPDHASGTSISPAQPPDPQDAASDPGQGGKDRNQGDGITMVAIERVVPNAFQPRRSFDEAALDTLAASIREAGMMQPVVLRPSKPGTEEEYELIAGERRWRAAQRVGLTRIPAVIRAVNDQTAAQWALIENIQREDLNAVERAQAFRRLADEFSLTHQQIAERVGLDRTSVTNHLRLLELDPAILDLLAAGALGMGHGRALLVITNSSRRAHLAQAAAREGWSVRELERRVRAETGGTAGEPPTPSKHMPAHIADLQRRLAEYLGSKVTIQPGARKGSGKITIEFFTLDEFEGLLDRLGFDPARE